MIYDALRQHFAATGLDVDEHADQGWLATEGFGEHGRWLLVAQAYEHLGQAAIYSVMPEKVADEHRTAMAVLLARINSGLVLGNFEIDLTDGEVRCKASIDFGGAEPTQEQLRPLSATALLQFDKYLPALRAVAGGADPAEAFGTV
jgi:hypothetical protein